MSVDQIFLLQFALSIVVCTLVAIRISPALNKLEWSDAMFWLAVPHALRHLGLVFLVPGVVSESMPGGFAAEAGYGDLSSAIAGILALIALGRGWAIAVPLLWVLNAVGVFDLMNALRQIEAVPHFNAAWYIPTFVVPVLLVTHAMMIIRLIRHATGSRLTAEQPQ